MGFRVENKLVLTISTDLPLLTISVNEVGVFEDFSKQEALLDIVKRAAARNIHV